MSIINFIFSTIVSLVLIVLAMIFLPMPETGTGFLLEAWAICCAVVYVTQKR
jgi:hypothetical protein